jgi:hypothetical protein
VFCAKVAKTLRHRDSKNFQMILDDLVTRCLGDFKKKL